MSDPSRRSSGSSGSNISNKRPVDPITRTALRYTISPREYELLHAYLISRAPQPVRKRTPDPSRYETLTKSKTEGGDYTTAAVRDALRLYAAVFVGFKSLSFVMGRMAARRGGAAQVQVAGPKNKNARMALSFSSILLFHRLLHRFFKRLRASLLEESAKPFRKRNPRVAHALTSQYTPAIGASLAGFCLGFSPADQLRMTIAIYVFSRSLEYGYNALAHQGYIWAPGKDRPWWFGSWLVMPFAYGQLLHAFVFDRDCFPADFGTFILKRSPEYIQFRPADYPASKTWPGTFDIVDGLAELSKLRWPSFISPILFPNHKQTLPASVRNLSPISGSAHPGIRHTSCAFLHPRDPSCARTYLKYWLSAFPSIAKFFTLVYGAFAMLAYKSLLKDPTPFLNRVAQRILRMSLFITGAIGTSWGSICLFNNILPRTVLPTQRWFLGGFLGGLWAYTARNQERDNFLYSFRLSVDSLYKVGKKRGWWRGIRNGDVLVFVGSLALVNVVYEIQPSAVQGGIFRKLVSSTRGEGWVDVAGGKKKAGQVEDETIKEGVPKDLKEAAKKEE